MFTIWAKSNAQSKMAGYRARISYLILAYSKHALAD